MDSVVVEVGEPEGGAFDEFDQLRIAGVRHADLKGFAFIREGVDARSLANAYAQSLGQVFTHEIKPMEVEILVAEIGLDAGGRGDQLFHILYDGTVADEDDWVVLGGETEEISERFAEALPEAPRALPDGVRAAVAALAGPDRTLSAEDLEAAVLDRATGRRAFRRLSDEEVATILEA